MNTLFQPYRLNDTLTLANRFMMAPLTRCMAGPGLVRNQFRDWCSKHNAAVAAAVVDSVAADHPTDAQLVAMARQYFKKFDNMAADPSLS